MTTTALRTTIDTDRDQSRDALAIKHLSLVYHLARQIVRSAGDSVELDDLVSAGSLGLMAALDSFDTSRGLAFSTFAVPRIRGAMLDELRKQDDATRTVRQKRRALSTARERLGHSLGRAPVAAETASFLGVDTQTVWRWEADAEQGTMVELDGPVGGDSGVLTLAEVLVGPGAESIEDGVNREQEVAVLRSAIMRLTERERVVLSLYYYEELTLNEIARVLGLTESRISQIRTKALGSLRQSMRGVRG